VSGSFTFIKKTKQLYFSYDSNSYPTFLTRFVFYHNIRKQYLSDLSGIRSKVIWHKKKKISKLSNTDVRQLVQRNNVFYVVYRNYWTPAAKFSHYAVHLRKNLQVKAWGNAEWSATIIVHHMSWLYRVTFLSMWRHCDIIYLL